MLKAVAYPKAEFPDFHAMLIFINIKEIAVSVYEHESRDSFLFLQKIEAHCCLFIPGRGEQKKDAPASGENMVSPAARAFMVIG